MNICFICSEYPPFPHGGIGSMTQVFGRALADRGHRIRVIGMYPEAGANAVEDDRGVKVWRLKRPEGRFGWVAGRSEIYRTVARWVRDGEVDVIEVPDWEGYAAGWPSLDAPLVVRLHGSLTYFNSEMKFETGRSTYLIESNSFHRADFCSSTSRYVANVTERLFGRHAAGPRVLYNFVDVRQDAAALRREPMRVVYAGSLATKKGVIPLANAWPEVLKRFPEAELHLFGKDAGTEYGGPMKDHLIALLGTEVRASVTFHGHVTREQVMQEFRTCRMAIFPSFSEAFSLVPMEAMAERCPVIFSNRFSGPELITHEADGLLIDPGDPATISRAIVRLLGDDELAARLGAAGRHTVCTRFSREALLGQFEDYYAACAASFRKSATQFHALSRLRLSAHV